MWGRQDEVECGNDTMEIKQAVSTCMWTGCGATHPVENYLGNHLVGLFYYLGATWSKGDNNSIGFRTYIRKIDGFKTNVR